MAFFSIIIPLYNKEKFIENTIQSVFNQTFQDFEIIIINDGSTDRSEEIVMQLKDSRIKYFSRENGGVSTARNFGIKNAKSDYVTFIDADDYWFPEFLSTFFEKIKSFPQQKVFAGAIEIETLKKTFPAQYSIKKSGEFEIVNYFKASLKETVICTSCAVFHKSIFDEIGLFDSKIKSGQDTDLWIRIGLIYPVLFIWKVMARYVYDDKSLSKNTTFLNNKMDFSKFIEQEKINPDLKYFLDLNRFSLAIKSKLAANKTLFNYYYKGIDLKKLSFRKRILLTLPSYLLRILIEIKLKSAQLGFGSSVFK